MLIQDKQEFQDIQLIQEVFPQAVCLMPVFDIDGGIIEKRIQRRPVDRHAA